MPIAGLTLALATEAAVKATSSHPNFMVKKLVVCRKGKIEKRTLVGEGLF
jgi:hypothetical protein